MIDIVFFHKSNQDGDNLLNFIQENFNLVDYEEIDINDNYFKRINIKNELSKFETVINSPQSQTNCMNRDIMLQILSQNAISYKRKTNELNIIYYDVLVFDTSIISIRQKILARNKKPISYIKMSQCMQAAEISKKAVYHLGLNYAMVKIALTAKREYKLLDVDTSPNIRTKDLKSLIIKLKNIQQIEPNLITDKEVKLGADPEFMLSRSSKMIAASTFFPRDGRVGCDNIRTRNRQQHPIAELRPRPSISPLELTENVKKALVSAIKMAPFRNIKWMAGSQPFKGYPIGGHIHFSNVKLNFAVLRSLDNFMAIPMFMLENPLSAGLRRKRYGTLADFRVKKHGGFEYRTLGSWLVSPEITRGVLCLAKIVISHYLELNQNYFANVEAQKAFYKGDQEYFKPVFEDLWSKICKTDMYSQYATELAVIHDMINDGLCWDEKDDLRKAWQIVGISKGTYSINKKKKIIKTRDIPTSTSRNVRLTTNSVASRQRHIPTAGSRSNERNRTAVASIGTRRNHQRNQNNLRSSYTIDLSH